MTPRTPKAFTLAESLAASVLLAVAVVGVSSTIIASQQQSSVQRQMHVMTMLSRQLLNRIVALPLARRDDLPDQRGWPAVTDPTQYDTVDDYAGYADCIDASSCVEWGSAAGDAVQAQPPTLTEYQAAAASDAIRRSVQIQNVATLNGSAIPTGDLVSVRVTVRNRSGQTLSLTQLVSRWTPTWSG